MTDHRRPARPKGPTATSSFGVGRREAHDSTAFYSRFSPPEILASAEVAEAAGVAEPFVCGDARKMDEVEDGSVALVVTSPPYFAGKQYEEELDREGVPSSYLEYLELLRDVFAECKRVLEPGGRIAVNVANLGRKPYRSLSADVTRILQDDLHLLLRGEVIWQKGAGAAGSCAWGSFRSPANPVLRDLTERVIVASKGRFDRAVSVKDRQARGLPHRSTLSSDEFMAATVDLWEIPPESARRVGHPAPFPVELPARLIHLYTFEGDLVLDPFMGSGSALVAASRLGRRFVGYDTDPGYVEIARSRVAQATGAEEQDRRHAEAAGRGKAILAIAEEVLAEAGFSVTRRDAKVPRLGLSVPLVAEDRAGIEWSFDVSGAFTTTRSGLARSGTLWRALGRASVLAIDGRRPLVLLTSELPRPATEADLALRAAGASGFFDAIELLSTDGRSRLARYAAGGQHHQALPGFWSEKDLGGAGGRAGPARAARRRPAPDHRPIS